MQRSLSILFCSLLLPVAASAQSVKITLPDNSTCTYATGQVVTNNATPGQLQATATATPTGNGCGTTTSTSPVTFGPAAPLSPALTILSGNTGTVNFSFTALNATTSCIGSITGAAGGAFTNGTILCSGAGCSGPVNAPASFTNSSTTANATYNVAVTCTGAGNPATSLATVTVPFTPPPPPTGCPNPPTLASTTSGIPNFTRFTGSPSVYYFGAGSNTVDVTSFAAIYWQAWPGNASLTADVSLPTNKYIAAEFKVPAGYIAGYHGQSPLYGDYTLNQSTGSGGTPAAVSMSISTSCGDFSNPATYPTTSTVVPGCWKNKLTGGGLLQWRASTTCILQDGVTYFLNEINADVSALQPGGAGTAASTKNVTCSSACDVPIANGPGTWSSYTFP
jgi:hypothetical protein